MEGGINLLPQLTEQEIKAGVYRRKINLAALGMLGAVGVIIVGLFGYQLFLTLRANNIADRTKKAENRIVNNRDVEIANKALAEKIKQAQNILTNEIPTSVLVDELSKAAATQDPIRLTGVTVSGGDLIVEGIAVGANPSENFKAWIENLTSSNGKDYFAAINLATLTGSKAEGYRFSFTMKFLKKGIYTARNEK